MHHTLTVACVQKQTQAYNAKSVFSLTFGKPCCLNEDEHISSDCVLFVNSSLVYDCSRVYNH